MKNRLKKLRAEYRVEKSETDRLNLIVLNADPGERWLPLSYWREHFDKTNKLSRKIKHLNLLIKGEASDNNFDVERLKEIPIGDIYETVSTGFFLNNPLRKERSPSNSLHWNRSTNRWTDYGSGEYGDVIDLVQKVNKCSFIEACKILSTCV